MKFFKKIKNVPDRVGMAMIDVCVNIEEWSYKQYKKTHFKILLYINIVAYHTAMNMYNILIKNSARRLKKFLKKAQA